MGVKIMIKQMRLRIIAFKIEWHWLFIKAGRKRGKQLTDVLINAGQPLNAPRLMRLSHRIDRRCARVTQLTQRYNCLALIDQRETTEKCSVVSTV